MILNIVLIWNITQYWVLGFFNVNLYIVFDWWNVPAGQTAVSSCVFLMKLLFPCTSVSSSLSGRSVLCFSGAFTAISPWREKARQSDTLWFVGVWLTDSNSVSHHRLLLQHLQLLAKDKHIKFTLLVRGYKRSKNKTNLRDRIWLTDRMNKIHQLLREKTKMIFFFR